MRVICDESGAKGRASIQEAFPGEVGVFVGVLVPATVANAFDADVLTMIQRYAPSSVGAAPSKRHLTDLLTADQQSLRTDVWSLMRRHGATWIYEAVHVRGFHDSHQELLAAMDRAKQGLTAATRPNVRPPEAPLLHTDLFAGLCATALAVALDAASGPSVVEVVLDHVDTGLVKAFQKALAEFYNDGDLELQQRGRDAATGVLAEATIRVRSSLVDPDVASSTFALKLLAAGDPQALVADVIANSLVFHFHQRKDAQIGARLHTADALVGYPIADLVVGMPTTTPHPADTLYPYTAPSTAPNLSSGEPAAT